MSANELSDAIVFGLTTQSWPSIDHDKFIEHYGEEKSAVLLPEIQSILTEAMKIQIDWNANNDLVAAGQKVEQIMAVEHPELSPDALKKIGNYFTYQWR